MKKIIIVAVIIMLVCIITGCKKKKEEGIDGGWGLDLATEKVAIPEDAIEAFDTAIKKEKNTKIKPIALLGTQVVAGTNYMFLCSSKEDSSYKIIIIYKDLNAKSSITKMVDFDGNKYFGKTIPDNSETIVGGWTIHREVANAKIKEDALDAFEKATAKEDEVLYKPIVVLGRQVVAGTNYAILSLKENKEGIASLHVLTIYQDLEKNAEIINSAYVDLADYNP